MSDTRLLVKVLNDDIIMADENINLYLCQSIKDRWKYSRIFIKGFNKGCLKSLICFLSCFEADEELYIVRKENIDIGCFTLKRKRKDIYLYDFTVLQKYRGQGLSKKVLFLIYNLCKSDGFNSLFLYLKKDNEVAKNLYLDEGFKYCRFKHNHKIY